MDKKKIRAIKPSEEYSVEDLLHFGIGHLLEILLEMEKGLGV